MKYMILLAATALLTVACNEQKESQAAAAPKAEIAAPAPVAEEALAPEEAAADQEAQQVEAMEQDLEKLLQEI